MNNVFRDYVAFRLFGGRCHHISGDKTGIVFGYNGISYFIFTTENGGLYCRYKVRKKQEFITIVLAASDEFNGRSPAAVKRFMDKNTNGVLPSFLYKEGRL